MNPSTSFDASFEEYVSRCVEELVSLGDDTVEELDYVSSSCVDDLADLGDNISEELEKYEVKEKCEVKEKIKKQKSRCKLTQVKSKIPRNERERKRVKQMEEGYRNLQTHIPFAPSTPLSRQKLIYMAMKYISALQNQLAETENSNDEPSSSNN